MYRITKRNNVLQGRGVDGRWATEEDVRKILKSCTQDIDKAIAVLNSGKIVRTKYWIIRIDK